MRRLLYLIGLVVIVSCSSIDCPVNNTVHTRYCFYNTDGDSLVLMDTLTVTTVKKDGMDTLILNRLVGKASFSLPMSYSHPEDDIPHFESVDCKVAYFHQLTGVRYTTHFVDSIVIKNPSVDYDKQTIHFYIYPKVGD